MKAIRYTTLVRRCGRPQRASRMRQSDFTQACRANRVLTVHHREGGAWFVPDWAETGCHIVNVVDKLVFPKPLPVPPDTLVLGVRRHVNPMP